MKRILIPALVLAACATACTKKPIDESASSVIRVGHVGSLTGSEATFGTNTARGIEMAVRELNAQGGLKRPGETGKRLELVSVDDRGKPEEAALAVRRLISESHVGLIIGENASSVS